MQAFLEYIARHNGEINIVYPGGAVDLESYVLDLESQVYSKYKIRLVAKYTDYRIYKKMLSIPFDTDFVIDPLCYKLEIKRKDKLFETILNTAEKGRE